MKSAARRLRSMGETMVLPGWIAFQMAWIIGTPPAGTDWRGPRPDLSAA